MTAEEKFNAVGFQQYGIYLAGQLFGGVDTDGGLTWEFKGRRIVITNVAGFFQHEWKSWSTGASGSLSITIKKPDMATLRNIYSGSLAANAKAMFAGIKVVEESIIAKELWLHPIAPEYEGDYNEDFKAYLAVPDIEGLNIALNTPEPGEITLKFNFIRDRTKLLDRCYFAAGDWSYSPATALGISFVMQDDIGRPGIVSLPQLKLRAGAVDRIKTLSNYGDSSANITFDLDMVGDLSASATNIIFDNLSIAGSLQIGDEVFVGTQTMYITAITYDSGNITGNFDCIRASLGTTAAIVLDGVSFAKVINLYADRSIDKVALVSADDTKAKIGNTVITSTEIERKGVLSNVATDAGTVITATENGVSQTIDIITE